MTAPATKIDAKIDVVTAPQEVQLELRSAQPTDAGVIGSILYMFQQDTMWMPKLYAEVEMISFCGVMIDRGWVTVALKQGVVKGFLARDGAEVCGLYLAPGTCGQGFGRALIAAAQTSAPHLWLKTFELNLGARQFYQRAGFTEVARRDGAQNEEGLSEVHFEWRQQSARSDAA